MNELYKLIVSVGDCEFSDSVEIVIDNKEKADEICDLLEKYGKNINVVDVLTIKR